MNGYAINVDCSTTFKAAMKMGNSTTMTWKFRVFSNSSNPTIGAHGPHTLAYGLSLAIVCYGPTHHYCGHRHSTDSPPKYDRTATAVATVFVIAVATAAAVAYSM